MNGGGGGGGAAEPGGGGGGGAELGGGGGGEAPEPEGGGGGGGGAEACAGEGRIELDGSPIELSKEQPPPSEKSQKRCLFSGIQTPLDITKQYTCY